MDRGQRSRIEKGPGPFWFSAPFSSLWNCACSALPTVMRGRDDPEQPCGPDNSVITLCARESIVNLYTLTAPPPFYPTTSSSFTLSPPRSIRKRKTGRSDSICPKGVHIDHR